MRWKWAQQKTNVGNTSICCWFAVKVGDLYAERMNGEVKNTRQCIMGRENFPLFFITLFAKLLKVTVCILHVAATCHYTCMCLQSNLILLYLCFQPAIQPASQPVVRAANKMSVIKYQCCFWCCNHEPDRDGNEGGNRNASYNKEIRDQKTSGKPQSENGIVNEEWKKANRDGRERRLGEGVTRSLRKRSSMSHVSLRRCCQSEPLFLGGGMYTKASWRGIITTNHTQHAPTKRRPSSGARSHTTSTREKRGREYRNMRRHQVFCWDLASNTEWDP